MINKVILTGRLTSDVELRRTNDGTPYTFFTIAVNRRNQDQTDFIACTAWRQTAELMANYLNKGSLVGVEWRLEVFSQQKDGKYETRTTVQVSQLTFLESKAQASSRTSDQNSNMNNNYQSQTNAANETPMTFADESSFNTNETTPVNESTFGKAEEINAKDINLEEIKF